MAISISIIIPVYNKGKYIESCIDSILRQSHRDFEVIVINDGSTDNTIKVLNSYNDTRLRIYSYANEGVSAARNHGIDLATKEYLTFVDGDDYIDSDYLLRYDEIISNSGCDIAIGGLNKTSDKESHLVFSKFANVCIDIHAFKKIFVSEQMSNEGIFGYVAAKFVKKDLLDLYGLRFDTQLKLAEDLEFWARVYPRANTLYLTNYSGYKYRLATDGSSIELPPQHLSQIKIWSFILEVYAQSEEYDRLEVFKKINGICEAYFLELEKLNRKNIGNGINFISSNLKYLQHELRLNAHTFLQKLICFKSVSFIWMYLVLRKIRHICLH